MLATTGNSEISLSKSWIALGVTSLYPTWCCNCGGWGLQAGVGRRRNIDSKWCGIHENANKNGCLLLLFKIQKLSKQHFLYKFLKRNIILRHFVSNRWRQKAQCYLRHFELFCSSFESHIFPLLDRLGPELSISSVGYYTKNLGKTRFKKLYQVKAAKVFFSCRFSWLHKGLYLDKIYFYFAYIFSGLLSTVCLTVKQK